MQKSSYMPLLSVVYAFSIILIGNLNAQPFGQSLANQVDQAYKDIDQYHATVNFRMEREAGRWTSIQKGEFIIAFDRLNERLKVDTPDTDLVIGDKKLRFRLRQVIDRYVQTDAPSPLTYEKLTGDIPFLSQWPLVDLAMLLSEKPIQAISNNVSSSATTLSPDDDGRPRFQFNTTEGTFTCSVNSETKRIEYVEVDVDTAAIGMDDGSTMKLKYQYITEKVNVPLDNPVFSFAVNANDTVVSSVQELVSGGGMGGGKGEHRLTDKPAPTFDLKDMDGNPIKMSDIDSNVVVLDFWATWCPPCRKGLPELQTIHDWANDEKLSVSVYAVNVGERVNDARRFWERQKFTMPVLMDTEGRIASDYGVEGIPQTVVIAGGIVRHVHVGLARDLAGELKQQIKTLLNEDNDTPN